MLLFPAKDAPVDRFKALETAAKARSRGNKKRAIAEYRRLLGAHPDDHEVHGKLAPLLVENKEPKAAWESYKKAGDGYYAKGFVDKAIAMFKQAVSQLPWEVGAWERVTDLYLERGRKADALKTLHDARFTFRGRADREKALRVMLRLLEIEPGRFDAELDLAWLLKKTGRKAEARARLEGLLEGRQGGERRQVRRALFFLSPTPGALFRWWLGR